jgi:hypothetical protein
MVYEKGYKPHNSINFQCEDSKKPTQKMMTKPMRDAWNPEFACTIEALSMDADLLAIIKKLIADPAFRSMVVKLMAASSTH